jgi:hypothetical protein
VEPCTAMVGPHREESKPLPDDAWGANMGWVCKECNGTGRVEVHEPFPLAGRAQRFDLEFVYPGIEDKSTGLMQRRPMSLTRLELEEYLLSLTALLKRVRAAEESGDWPAVVSDAACSECPAPSMCPIPAELRDHRGTINSHEQAAEALEVLDRRKAVDAAIRREVKAFAKHNGPVRWGADRVSEFVSTFAEEIKDREGMVDSLVPGCWVVTGFNCPDCKPTVEEGDRA